MARRAEEAGELLDAVCDEVVKKRWMPMPVPRGSIPRQVTDVERKRLCDWANAGGELGRQDPPGRLRAALVLKASHRRAGQVQAV